jgi:hypothetical protein
VDLVFGYEQSLVVGACERGNEHSIPKFALNLSIERLLDFQEGITHEVIAITVKIMC